MNNKNNTKDHTNGNARVIIWNPPGSDVTEEIFDGGGGGTGGENAHLSDSEKASAVEISVGTPVSGYISEAGVEQFFKFTTPTQDVYSIFTTGNLDTIGYLYDSDGDLIILVDDLAPGSENNFHIIQTLAAGATYYIKVNLRNNSTGEYTLKVTKGIPVRVKHENGLNVMSAANDGSILGTFANTSTIWLVNENPQNEVMFRVYGTMNNGVRTYGWCSGEYLEKEVVFKEWNDSGNINVRSETNTNNNTNIIGKLPPSGKVRLLQENHTKNSHIWHKISYAGCDAYIADQSELSTKSYWIPLIRKKVGDNLTNQDINHIVANIQNCSEISSNKRAAAASFAKILLENYYEPTFVAGILANLEKEGNIGQLENSNYVKNPDEKPDYLIYMDSQYNGSNYYLNNYSNKTIMDLGVNAVYNILLNLKNSSNDTWKINGSRVGFGIGSFQWTFDRSWNLMSKYREQNNGVNTITNSQVINAEKSMLIDELESDTYYDVLPFWEDQCTSHFNTVEAANRAGFTVCTHYLKPKDTNQSQIRATLAEQIYADMMA